MSPLCHVLRHFGAPRLEGVHIRVKASGFGSGFDGLFLLSQRDLVELHRTTTTARAKQGGAGGGTLAIPVMRHRVFRRRTLARRTASSTKLFNLKSEARCDTKAVRCSRERDRVNAPCCKGAADYYQGVATT